MPTPASPWQIPMVRSFRTALANWVKRRPFGWGEQIVTGDREGLVAACEGIPDHAVILVRAQQEPNGRPMRVAAWPVLNKLDVEAELACVLLLSRYSQDSEVRSPNEVWVGGGESAGPSPHLMGRSVQLATDWIDADLRSRDVLSD